MRFILSLLALALLACAATTAAQEPAEASDATVINQLIERYQVALNASDVDAIVQLYAKDAVFMPQHVPAAIGRDAIRDLYGGILGTIDLDIAFMVDEIEVLGDTAWARTRSRGTVRLKTGDGRDEGNQELFLFRKATTGAWHIARYIFTTTNPPAGS